MKLIPEISKIIQLSGHNGSVYNLLNWEGSPFFISLGGDGWVVKWKKNGLDPDGKLIGKIDGKIFSGCMIQDSNQLVVGDFDGDLYWIDLDKTDVSRRVRHHKGSVFDLKNHKACIYSVGGDGFFVKWSVNHLLPIESVKISAKALRSLWIDELHDLAYIGSSDGNIYQVDLLTMRMLDKWSGLHKSSVFSLCDFSGKYLFSGGRDAMLVKTQISNCKDSTSVNAHWFTINKIISLPEFNFIITASRDKTFRIWDVENLSLLKSIDVLKSGHVNSVNTLLWINESNILATSGDDRSIILWKILMH